MHMVFIVEWKILILWNINHDALFHLFRSNIDFNFLNLIETSTYFIQTFLSSLSLDFHSLFFFLCQ